MGYGKKGILIRKRLSEVKNNTLTKFIKQLVVLRNENIRQSIPLELEGEVFTFSWITLDKLAKEEIERREL